MHSEKKKILVIAGASGSGKSTIVRYLLKRYASSFALSVSYTTRTPRENEEPGREYHFLTKDEFRAKIEENELLEYAEYAGNYYGTGDESLKPRRDGKILILEIEKKGVESVKKLDIPAVYLYIYADTTQLHKRISARAIISEDELSKRLMRALEENVYGCSGAFDKVIENDELNTTLREVDRFIHQEFGIQVV
ncbi:guanylate kinase [Nematocida homosporus]|uniref:guanylate kinase n=1 Tax=Nematocida homosporus TaxID=1912981 RepID=UPI00221EDA79|nr:guanylate kinase [Nematocida homosporus]KAI5184319.1 guanylate kinase [Nematocida homosporus]